MRKKYIQSGLAIVMVIIAMVAFNFIAGLVGLGALTLAMAGTAVREDTLDTEAIDDAESGLQLDQIAKAITEMRPSRTPLDTIMRTAPGKTVTSKSWKYRYYAVDNRPFTDTVASEYTAASATSGAVSVDNIDMWNADDTALVRGSTGTDGQEVMLYVYDVDSANDKILVQCRNNADNYIPTIAEDTVLTRMGNGKNEQDMQTSPFAMIPEDSYNYLQYFMAQVEMSEIAQKHNKEVNFNFNDLYRQQIYDFKATLELSFIFGVRGELTHKLDKALVYLTGGITRFIDNELEYGTGGSDRTITHDNLIDWSKSIFASNAGSSSRIMFSGSGFTANLMKIKKVQDATSDVTVDYITKQLSAENVNVKLGLKFRTIETNFGTLYHYYHPLFDEAGWDDKAVVIDPANLDKAVMEKLTTKTIDLKGSGQKRADAKVIREICAPIVRYPDTHAIIAPAA